MSTIQTPAATPPVGPGTGQFFIIQSLLPGNHVLDVRGNDPQPGQNVISWSLNSQANQQWQFTPVADEPGWWFLQTRMATGFVMTLDAASPLAPGPIVMLPPEPSNPANQLWSLVPTSQLGYWYIQSKTVVSNAVGAVVIDIAGGESETGADVLSDELSFVDYDSQAWGFRPMPVT